MISLSTFHVSPFVEIRVIFIRMQNLTNRYYRCEFGRAIRFLKIIYAFRVDFPFLLSVFDASSVPTISQLPFFLPFPTKMDLPDSPPPLDAPSPPHFLDAPQDRWNVFYPAVQTLVNALGGYEEVESPPDSGIFETVYRPGDSVLGVLKDLKKLWRKDDEDDERTVARCMHKAELMKELVAILVECAERGEWGRKVALVACKLIVQLSNTY